MFTQAEKTLTKACFFAIVFGIMSTVTIKDCSAAETATAAAYFLQTRFWAEFKQQHGWTYRRFEVSNATNDPFVLTVLMRPLEPFGLLAYIPMGPDFFTDCDSALPETAEKRGVFLADLVEAVLPLLPSRVFLIRFDPPWGCTVKNGKEPEQTTGMFPLIPHTGPRTRPYRKPAYCILKAETDIQPPDTVVLDLRQPLDALLNDCKPKWRYNIRLAEKKGVHIRCFSGAEAAAGIPLFYTLYRETAARDGIAIHAESYYQSLCTLAADPQYNTEHIVISVYVAFFEEKPLAAIITLFSPTEAVYLYGASSNEHRNMMPAYLLQWQAIQDAHGHGCITYDFYGIPPSEDPSHPMHGLYRFKTGFGGMIIHRVGTLDIPVRNCRYRFYSFAERLRAWWFKSLKKKLRTVLRKH